ncbi:MAG: Crp/Fnr family transcriptional regulator [Nitrospirae bacterium]|nr:Crp/Fnr family transcriptional regulator [Nitrospirota bacterium]
MNEDGKELTLAILEPGEVFGEMEVLEGMPRDTVAEALDDVSICVMQRSDFEALLKKDPNTNIRLTKLIGLRLKKIESRIEDLVFKDVPARLAHLLFELSKEFGVQENGQTRLSVKLSHQELANLIGSTRETVTATLGDFKRRGLIAFDGRRLVILREKELEKLLPSKP